MTVLILMDQPDDCYCEERGWVEAIISADEARDLLAPFCGEDPPERPIGTAERVWLSVDDASLPDGQQRWHPCEPDAEGAVEFWQFDATDTERLAGSGTGADGGMSAQLADVDDELDEVCARPGPRGCGACRGCDEFGGPDV